MAINNISNNNSIISTSIQSQNNNVENNIDTTSNTPASTETIRREDTSSLGSSLIRLQLQQSLPSNNLSSATSGISNNSTIPNTLSASTSSTTSTNSASSTSSTTATSSTNPTTSTPALNPLGTFQQPLNNFLANIFRVPNAAINNTQTNIQVNSANQFQTGELSLNGGGTIRLFNNLPPSNVFPPQTTAQIPRVYLDSQGVISVARSMQPLAQDQRNQIANLYSVDQASRRNYGVNVQNIASALTQIKNSSSLDPQTTQLVNAAIASLGNSYNQIANFAGRTPDPDTVYKQVTNVLQLLNGKAGVNQSSVNNALNIVGIGYSNYLFNRLPINGTNNPTATTAAALPAFNANKPLSQAQANPSATFGSNVLSYLNSIGITGVDPGQIQYQVNSADKLQTASVRIPGSNQPVTLFFNGNFPVTNATPPQIEFGGIRGARDFTRVENGNPATQQRLVNFYTNNAQPRANYVANLNNIIAGLQTFLGGCDPTTQRIVSDNITLLQNAVTGLNATPTKVPDVLRLYKQVGQTLDFLGQINPNTFSSAQRQALNTLNSSTLPIGITNYYARPVTQTQSA
ncbi:MAG: hypothetical protein HY819_11105 [Acidobacteria bacterium]|nr:hypothetical protein [Acidobacteriota bacterium]